MKIKLKYSLKGKKFTFLKSKSPSKTQVMGLKLNFEKERKKTSYFSSNFGTNEKTCKLTAMINTFESFGVMEKKEECLS